MTSIFLSAADSFRCHSSVVLHIVSCQENINTVLEQFFKNLSPSSEVS